jgi:hypothetical protein
MCSVYPYANISDVIVYQVLSARDLVPAIPIERRIIDADRLFPRHAAPLAPHPIIPTQYPLYLQVRGL